MRPKPPAGLPSKSQLQSVSVGFFTNVNPTRIAKFAGNRLVVISKKEHVYTLSSSATGGEIYYIDIQWTLTAEYTSYCTLHQ